MRSINPWERAYAHHIQRLMLTGNFASLLGTHPDAVDAWYLGIYMDAIEWVEMPNARGMSQFADGGVMATKPYVSSANYIHKMSDYCRSCRYDPKVKTGPDACPFNALYWIFLIGMPPYSRKSADRHGSSKPRSDGPHAAPSLFEHAEWIRNNIDRLLKAKTEVDMVWFKRDLRLHDHDALSIASESVRPSFFFGSLSQRCFNRKIGTSDT